MFGDSRRRVQLKKVEVTKNPMGAPNGFLVEYYAELVNLSS